MSGNIESFHNFIAFYDEFIILKRKGIFKNPATENLTGC